MPSNIDPTKPATPIAYTVDMRNNFAAAKAEIEANATNIAAAQAEIEANATNIAAAQAEIDALQNIPMLPLDGGGAVTNSITSFSRTDTGVMATYPPMLVLNYLNQTSGGPLTHAGPIALRVNATSSAGNPNFSTFGIASEFIAGSTNGSQSQDVAIAANVTKPGGANNIAFIHWATLQDTSGYGGDNTAGPNRGGLVGMEMDFFVSGPENPLSMASPLTGSRSMLVCSGVTYKPAIWVANTAYTLNRSAQPVTANGFTYVCTAAGTSGATEPVWPTSAGSVTDGTVTWTYGTTIAAQISRAFLVNSAPGEPVQFGAGYAARATFYDAICEFSGASLVGSSAAAIRLAAEHPIDFSGGLSTITQNNHTLRFTALGTGGQRLSYQRDSSGTEGFSCDNFGTFRIGNNTASSTILDIDTVAGAQRQIRFTTGGVLRWTILTGSVAETGANAGSNFALVRYDDSGAVLGNTMVVNRASGALTLSTPLLFNPLPTNAANDAAAAAAGVVLNGIYRNGSILMVRVV